MRSHQRDRSRPRSARLRRRALTLLLLFVTPIMAGCLRVNAAITVSNDDQVSGTIFAAVKPRDDKDQGPQFADDLPFADKVAVSRYDSDGYVGSQASFSGLTFAEVPQLADLSRDATGVDISLRRAGEVVILEGRVDLTNLTDPDADVEFSVAFPGEIVSTNGEQIDSGVVQWQLKPGVVSTLSAQAKYTDPSTRSFTTAATWLAVTALLVSGLIGFLAWRDRDQTSPRFTGVE